MGQPNKQKIPVGIVLSGKYRVTRELGRGGMAAVYEAENVDIGKRVAIKVLAQELTSSSVVVERFLREARAAAAIRSPYICDVYDSGRLEDGRPFLVLELLEGESLYEHMTKVRQLDVATTVQIVTQTCRGLTKAHKASIVHRDLKPENIFLTKDEEGKLLTKILDFGLAKFYSPVDEGEKQARLTREGAVFGTPAYMSPEQVRGQGTVDHRADLWALGCITYECLTGKTVWATEQGVAMTFAQIASSPIPNPTVLRPDLPLAFVDWFAKALDRAIDNRFQNAKDLAAELAAAFQQGPPSFSAIHDMSAFLEANPSSSTDFSGPNSRPLSLTSEPSSALPASSKPRPPPPPPSRTKPYPAPPKPPSAAPSLAGTLESEALPMPTSSARGSNVAVVAPVDPPSPREDSLVHPSQPQASQPAAPARGGAGKVALVLGSLAVLGGGAFFGANYVKNLFPASQTPLAATASASATATEDQAPSITSAEAPTPSMPAGAKRLPWIEDVRTGQASLAAGDLNKAITHFQAGFAKGGHGVPRTLLEHANVALAAQAGATCALTGLGRPRSYDLADGVRQVGSGPPSIAYGPNGAVMTWTDAHDGSEHAYAALLDSALRVTSGPFDVTPEGNAIARAQLTPAGERFVLTYWESRGPETGVHVRFLDANGRIAGPAVQVTASKGQNFWPSLEQAKDESFYITWTDDGDAESDDLFLKHLSPTLSPLGDAVRITDLARTSGARPRARVPSLAIWGDAVHIAFRLERDPSRLIEHLRIPLDQASTDVGPTTAATKRVDRFVGEDELVNTDRARADSPSLACANDACVLAWHGELQGGAWAAYINADKAKPMWRKRFAKAGAHPSVAISPSGVGQLAWYEAGQVLTASIGRGGVANPSKLARVVGDQPMPSISASRSPGEWYIAWRDFETGHLEPYVARVRCK